MKFKVIRSIIAAVLFLAYDVTIVTLSFELVNNYLLDPNSNRELIVALLPVVSGLVGILLILFAKKVRATEVMFGKVFPAVCLCVLMLFFYGVSDFIIPMIASCVVIVYLSYIIVKEKKHECRKSN